MGTAFATIVMACIGWLRNRYHAALAVSVLRPSLAVCRALRGWCGRVFVRPGVRGEPVDVLVRSPSGGSASEDALSISSVSHGHSYP